MSENRKHPKKKVNPSTRFQSRPPVSEAGMRILRLLIGRPPKTMLDLIKSLNITRTAVTEQVNDLVAVGYVEQTQEKCQGRGRPRYLFSATKLAMQNLFEGSQDIVCPALWQAIQRRVGKQSMESICHEVAEKLADSYNKQLSEQTPKERLSELIDLLVCQGRLVEMKEKKGGLELYLLSCPFYSMTEETGSICRIHQLAMKMILGESASVNLIAHRTHEGRYCCVFHVRRSGKNNVFPDWGKDI